MSNEYKIENQAFRSLTTGYDLLTSRRSYCSIVVKLASDGSSVEVVNNREIKGK